MAYTFRYRIESKPEPRVDGSGQINHDIYALVSTDAGITWEVVPGVHRTVVLPAADLKTVMDMPQSTAAQKNVKTAAYKQLLVAHRNDQAVPLFAPAPLDWDSSGLTTYLALYAAWKTAFDAANTSAATEAARANIYITVTLGQSYPVAFSL